MPRGSGLKIKTEQERFFRGGGGFLSKTSLNRHGQTKRPTSRVRQAFQSKVRVQPYSTAHNDECIDISSLTCRPPLPQVREEKK